MNQALLSTRLKKSTKKAHQELEKKVISRLKAIRSEADYAEFLNSFYSYFHTNEISVKQYLTENILSDYADRRNSDFLKSDIEELGFEIQPSKSLPAPQITSLTTALGAMYVMEGSIMGGPIIVQMLKKYGVSKGFSFFSGYGSETAQMWDKFLAVIDANVTHIEDQQVAIDTANETFTKFIPYF